MKWHGIRGRKLRPRREKAVGWKGVTEGRKEGCRSKTDKQGGEESKETRKGAKGKERRAV